MDAPIFSNEWLTWAWNNYSMIIVAFPSIVAFVLKLIAIYNPNIKSGEVNELIEQYWPKK